MNDEQHKARLKHAAEVLGWLAEGKGLEWKDGDRWAPVTPGLSPAARVDYIIQTGEVYRVKPEPVAKELFVLRDPFGDPVIDLRHTGFVIGDRVTVTKLES